MGKISLPSLPPGAFKCSFESCSDRFSSKKALFQHLIDRHGSSSSRQIPLYCPYCQQNIIGKGLFDRHVSMNGDCSAIREISCSRHKHRTDELFDFPANVMQGLVDGKLTVVPNQKSPKTFEITVVPAKERPHITLNAEEKMIRKWVECWLRARSRGDKEISINEMMATATEMAYETQIYSSQAIKTLNGHSSEAGRQRFLRKHNAFINPVQVKMPRGEPAYIFPFASSLSRELEKPELANLLNFEHFPPLLQSLKAPNGVDTVFPLLHVDDINLCNPLGSKRKKHSMRIFQWQLFNLPPWCRSNLQAKHPLAIANANSFKVNPEQAWRKILHDFIATLKQFANGGFLVSSLNREMAVRLGSILGDGLGLFEILGLSMSFGSHASKVCFRCEIGGGEALNGQHQPEDFVRTRQKILDLYQRLDLAPNDKLVQELQHEYGIRFKCPFFDLDYVGNYLKFCYSSYHFFHI